MKDPIHITAPDKQRLDDLLAEVEATDPRLWNDLKPLVEELQRAVVVHPREIAGDIITMNSRAELLDLANGETVTFTLVFPPEANVDEERISILAPIGAGMLGYRVGDEFKWPVPQGVRRMKVTRIDYQPEAAGGFNR
ncbi:MAG TPA: nucleoside diphosphate kinase regulator [Candidatus Acidoferrum sp.]|nr:nucleoside diphosphate kinase regulator [Candidatus Acidoferrum sp.]